MKLLTILKNKIKYIVSVLSDTITNIFKKSKANDEKNLSETDSINKDEQVDDMCEYYQDFNENLSDKDIEDLRKISDFDNFDKMIKNKRKTMSKDEHARQQREHDSQKLQQDKERVERLIEREKEYEKARKEYERKSKLASDELKAKKEAEAHRANSISVIKRGFSKLPKYCKSVCGFSYNTILNKIGFKNRIIKSSTKECEEYHKIRNSIIIGEILCDNEVNIDDSDVFTIRFYRPLDIADLYDFNEDDTHNITAKLRVDLQSYNDAIHHKNLYEFTGTIKEVLILIECSIMRCEYLLFDKNHNVVLMA